jgi:hypothetical protein
MSGLVGGSIPSAGTSLRRLRQRAAKAVAPKLGERRRTFPIPPLRAATARQATATQNSLGEASELCNNARNSKLLMRAAKILLLTGLAGFLPAKFCFAQTWTQTSAPSNLWSCVASSADGTKLIASVIGGGIWLSQDSGATWRKTSAPEIGWGRVACSADGNILFAVGDYFFLPTVCCRFAPPPIQD